LLQAFVKILNFTIFFRTVFNIIRKLVQFVLIKSCVHY
jgi:hypothetical protein